MLTMEEWLILESLIEGINSSCQLGKFHFHVLINDLWHGRIILWKLLPTPEMTYYQNVNGTEKLDWYYHEKTTAPMRFSLLFCSLTTLLTISKWKAWNLCDKKYCKTEFMLWKTFYRTISECASYNIPPRLYSRVHEYIYEKEKSSWAQK